MKIRMTRTIFIRIFLVVALCSFLYSHMASAQNWQALPPYNTLWPLWSPALSPVDLATGLPTPLVSNLVSDTVLPVMPGLTWDPIIPYPWLLYNAPTGMVYFDPLFGINTWPPKYLSQGKTALPIALPPGYSALAPTNASILKSLVPAGNFTFISTVPLAPALTSLLTAADIVGVGPAAATMTPTVLTPVVPPSLTPVTPVPTPTVPPPIAVISALAPLLPGGGTTLPATAVAPVVAPVTTNWSGIWTSLLSTSQLGPMNLTLIQDTITGAVDGTVSLILNKLVPLPVSVIGTFLGGTTFTLTGTYTGFQPAIGGLFLIPIDYTVTLNCNITSATTMDGTYSIISVKETDFGAFNVSLL
ncbi:MAG: hypothetical protein ACMUJM_13770 [bacterium]